MDAALKKQQRELKYLTQLRDALQADADRLESAKAAASATARSLDLELQVVRKQAEIGATTPAPESLAQYRKLLRDMLESQRTAAERAREASDKRKALAEKRLKQLDTLSKLGE
jgi:hypothetical protein